MNSNMNHFGEDSGALARKYSELNELLWELGRQSAERGTEDECLACEVSEGSKNRLMVFMRYFE